MKQYGAIILMTIAALFVSGCAQQAPTQRHKAVFMLLDTSGTYTEELNKAQLILNYLLGTLESGDSLAVARIDSGSFSEKDIVAKVTFDLKPSLSNAQKRSFKRSVDDFIRNATGSAHTDISGGVLQATQYLNETGAGEKYVLIFSDLEEDLTKGHIRDFSFPLGGINVIALNVTKLRTDNIDPRDYLNRLDKWEKKVNEGGGHWKVINNLERLDSMIKAS